MGSHDITRLVVDINMMGFANNKQISPHVYFRLRDKTFIMGEPNGKILIFMNMDIYMAFHLVTIKLL